MLTSCWYMDNILYPIFPIFSSKNHHSLGCWNGQKSASKQVDSVLEVLHSMCPSAKVEHVVSPRREEDDSWRSKLAIEFGDFSNSTRFFSTGEKFQHKSSCHKFDNSLEEIHGMWHVHLFTTIWQHLWVENSQIASLFFLSKLLPRAEVPGVLSEAPGTENPGKMFFNPHIISKVPCSLRLHLPVQGLPALARNQSCLHETPQWEVQHWVLLGLTPAKWQFLRHVFLPFCPAILYVETGQVQNTLIAKSRHNDSAGVKGGLSQVVVRAPSNVCTAITGQKAANKWKCEKLDLEHPTNTWQCPEICY